MKKGEFLAWIAAMYMCGMYIKRIEIDSDKLTVYTDINITYCPIDIKPIEYCNVMSVAHLDRIRPLHANTVMKFRMCTTSISSRDYVASLGMPTAYSLILHELIEHLKADANNYNEKDDEH